MTPGSLDPGTEAAQALRLAGLLAGSTMFGVGLWMTVRRP